MQVRCLSSQEHCKQKTRKLAFENAKLDNAKLDNVKHRQLKKTVKDYNRDVQWNWKCPVRM